MSSYDVNIYITAELYNESGYDPLYRANDFIQGAFDNTSHSVDLTNHATLPDPPTESTHTSFETTYPCDETFNVQYEHVADWFEDWLGCNASNATDCNLLITDGASTDRGLTWNNRYATTEGGSEIANLPTSYTTEGTSKEFSAMSTALHEVAHAFMTEGSDIEHNTGYVFNQDGWDYYTPMGISDRNGSNTNECDDEVDTSGSAAWKMYWSTCCKSYW